MPCNRRRTHRPTYIGLHAAGRLLGHKKCDVKKYMGQYNHERNIEHAQMDETY